MKEPETKKPHTLLSCLYDISRIVESGKTENKLMVAWDWRQEWEKWKIMDDGVSVLCDKNVLINCGNDHIIL